MELVEIGEKTYYIKNATNIGIYRVDDRNVYIIDIGNDIRRFIKEIIII